MRYLLDTHVWIWSIDAPERMAEPIRDIIEDASNELILSSITFWETQLLHEHGRVSGGGDVRLWIDFALHEYPIREIPIDRRIAVESRLLAIDTADPADRFIAATARLHDAVLLTHDEALRRAVSVPTIDF